MLKDNDINDIQKGKTLNLSNINFNQNDILGKLVYDTNKEVLDDIIPAKHKTNFIYTIGSYVLEELNKKK